MDYPPERWALVAVFVITAMQEKAWSQADLVRASGVSEFTVRKILKATPGNYRPDRLAKLSTALGWSGDSIQRILDGEEPVQARPTDVEGRLDRLEEEVETMRELIDIIEREYLLPAGDVLRIRELLHAGWTSATAPDGTVTLSPPSPGAISGIEIPPPQQFAVAASGGLPDEEGPVVNRPSPEPEPEGP